MAGVVRRENYSSSSPFSFADLEHQGRLVLERAEAQAAEIVSQAQQRGRRLAEQARQESHRLGLQQGRDEGARLIRAETEQKVLQEARQRLDRLAQALSTALDALERDKRRLIGLAEAGLIKLAMAIARRVCKLTVQASSAAAQSNARHLLELVEHHGDLELRVNPGDYEALREVAAELVRATDKLGHLEVVATAAVPPGGCVLHVREGQIDATIETQLQRIAEALLAGPGLESDRTNANTEAP